MDEGHQQHGQRGQHAQGGKAKCVLLCLCVHGRKPPLKFACFAAVRPGKKTPLHANLHKGARTCRGRAVSFIRTVPSALEFHQIGAKGCLRVRGLSPPVGNFTPPRNKLCYYNSARHAKMQEKTPCRGKNFCFGPRTGIFYGMIVPVHQGRRCFSPPPRKKPRPRRHAALCAAVQGARPPAGARGLLF